MAQPLPSWDELSSRLGALLGRLEAGRDEDATEEDATDLECECRRWREDVTTAAAAVAGPMGPAEREALVRWAYNQTK